MLPVLTFNFMGSYLNIYTYNLFIGVGLITSILFYQFICTKKGISKSIIDNTLVIIVTSIVIGFIGAFLFNKIVYMKQLEFNLLYLFQNTGMTFYGGFLFGFLIFVVCYFLFIKDMKIFHLLLNCCVISLVLGHFWGRIGCFLGGCCFGQRTNSWIGVIFSENTIPGKYFGYSVKLIPTQLIESAFLLSLFFILVFFLFDYSLEMYLILYGFFRFVIEFFRGDNRGELINVYFSPSQQISIVLIILGFTILLFENIYNKNKVKKVNFYPRSN